VIEDVPVFPSLVAVITTGGPAATAVTKPVDETVACTGSFDDQVTTRPLRTLPLMSWSVAVSECVRPTVRVTDDGLTITVATGGVTVIEAEPVMVSLVAVIVALPPPTAVIVAGDPVAVTVSTAGLLEVQVIVRPESRLPLASLVVAVSCCVPPTLIGVVGEEIVTAATGTRMTVRDAGPLLFSLVAIMLALPAATAVTRPVVDTVATAMLSEDQVMMRPASTWSLTSSVVAVACVVWPT
jgi:hypothetical protein